MNPDQFIYNRLNIVDKLHLYAASKDRIAHLANNSYRGDMNLHNVPESDRETILLLVQDAVVNEMKHKVQNLTPYQ